MKFLVKQPIEPGENVLTQSVLLFLVSHIPPCLHCTDSQQQHQFSLFHWPACWPNQSGNFGAALTTRCSRLSEAWMPLPSSTSDSSSSLQSSLLLIGLSTSPFQLSQFSVLEMLSGRSSASLSTRWRSIVLIWLTFNTSVCPPGRFVSDNTGGKSDLSDYFNAAAPSCWKFDQDAMMISPVSEMYPTAGISCFQHNIPSV